MASQYPDPNLTLIIQIIIAAVTIFGSFFGSWWISKRQGEMAASKYVLTDKKRMDHANDIVEGQLYELEMYNIMNPQAIMKVLVSDGKLTNYQFDIQLEEPFPIEYEFLFSHLKTGYPDLYQNLIHYKQSYNHLSNQILQYYNDMLEKWGFSLRKAENYIVIIRIISEIFSNAFNSNQSIQEAKTEYDIHNFVRLSGNRFKVRSEQDAQEIRETINVIFREHFDDVSAFWETIQSLREEQKTINTAFKRIDNNIQAGLPLKGYCSAGRTAGYE